MTEIECVNRVVAAQKDIVEDLFKHVWSLPAKKVSKKSLLAWITKKHDVNLWKCPGCKTWAPMSSYPIDRTRKYGRRTNCFGCEKERRLARYDANPQKFRDASNRCKAKKEKRGPERPRFVGSAKVKAQGT